MLDKQTLIERVKGLHFLQNEYWLLAGGAMVLHGFKQQTRDIDLGCTTALADKLEEQGYSVLRADDGKRKIVYSQDVEIFENWLEDRIVLVDGIPVVSVGGLVRMKQQLGREKDIADLALIKSNKS